MVVAEKRRMQFAFVSILGSFCALFLGFRATPCAAQVEEPQTNYVIADDPYVYELKAQPHQPNVPSTSVPGGPAAGGALTPSGPRIFNWAARRDPCFLISGDLPRFALARTFQSPSVDPVAGLAPNLAKLGDLRIRIQLAGKSVWLDELGSDRVRFYPWGTVHDFSPRPDFPVEVEVRATLVKDAGIAIEIEFGAPSAKSLEGTLDLIYGGLAFQGGFPSGYMTSEAQDAKSNTVTLEKAGGVIADAKIPVQVIALADPIFRVSLDPSNRLDFQSHFALKRNKSIFRFLAYQKEASGGSDLALEHFDDYVQETRKYYDTLVKTVEIQTPDKVLDSAFYAGLVNLDYGYQPPAWLEGTHGWRAYWVNNYQISAAIDLGQLDRARRALIFFANRPGGPGQTLKVDGSVVRDWVNVQFEGGLPYYILQLYRYWLATGDRKTLDEVWPATKENLERLLQTRDPDGNLLLDWMLGGNMFLYQSDHLSFPGDGFSPTLMVAANLTEMADMAEARGETGDAQKWRHRADYMQSELARRFWLPKEGRFIAGVDGQGLVMKANFYTDFVFPQLYSNLPADYTWTSLLTLDRTLWMKNGLMRTGNYMPPEFGNNPVLPVEMAESAEAYFQAGLPSRGWRLMHGVAVATTIATNSPGSFPESMTDAGFGKSHYVFGNPAGAYIRAAVSGLFGFEKTSSNRPLVWRPSIPDDWSSAKLRVGDISMRITGIHGERTFSLSLPEPQALEFRAPLHGHRVKEVKDASGRDLEFTILPHPSGDFLQMHLATAREFEIQVHSTQGSAIPPPPAEPQPDPVRHGALQLAGKREPVPIADKLNSDSISFQSFWWGPTKDNLRRKPVKVELPACSNTSSANCNLLVGRSNFRVSAKGQNMVMLEMGQCHPYTQELILSQLPDSLRLQIGKPVRGIEFLVASEVGSRLTGVQVGEVELLYSTGAEKKEPLIYGRNIDCFTIPFATETDNYEINPHAHLSAFVVKADASRNLEAIKLNVFAADTSIGILGINLVLPD
jgi:hypothetical protein